MSDGTGHTARFQAPLSTANADTCINCCFYAYNSCRSVMRMVRSAGRPLGLLWWTHKAKALTSPAQVTRSVFRTLVVGMLCLLVTMAWPVAQPLRMTARPGTVAVPALRSGPHSHQQPAHTVICVASAHSDGCAALAGAVAGVAVVSHSARAVAHRWATRIGAALVEDINAEAPNGMCRYSAPPLHFRVVLGNRASDPAGAHMELPTAVACNDFKQVIATTRWSALHHLVATETLNALERRFEAQLRQLVRRPHLALLPLPSATPSEARQPGGRRTVAFVASELSPVTAGGAGVVAAALAVELASSGTHVVVIATIPCADARAWAPVAQRAVDQYAHGRDHHQAPAAITVLCAQELVAPLVIPQAACHRHPAMHDTIVAALAVQKAYQLHAFDAVEFFDFNGPAFELLRARIDHLHPLATAPAAAYPCLRVSAAHANASASVGPYIPLSVPVLVRTHGTIHAIDIAEAQATGSKAGSTDPDLRYALEQYALQAATAVVAQTSWVADSYTRWYDLQPARLAISAPPMAAVMALQQVPAEGRGICPTVSFDASKGPALLVYGKLQAIKAPELIAAAFAAVATSELAANRSMQLVYLGRDARCSQHAWQPMQTCILQRLPVHLHGLVSFHPAVPGHCLQSTLATIRPIAAVFASSFETFNLAAHEVAAHGVPVVVSTAVALDHFVAANAYIFEAGNEAALAAAMREVLHAAPGDRKAPAVVYARDPAAIYRNASLLALQPPVLAPRTRRLMAKWVWDEL